MDEPKKAYEIRFPMLSDLLTPEQEAQLTILLANLMAHKYGTLEIEIVDGKVKFFKPKPSIKAKPPFD